MARDRKEQQQSAEFRWQALFQRSAEPLFLLNRQRRILFVNQAWERLTGISATEARGLLCRRRTIKSEDPWDLSVRSLCCPPPEVLQGRPGKLRRFVPRYGNARWWDLDFLPFRDGNGLLCVVGKITPQPGRESTRKFPLPEKLVALRQRVKQRYSVDILASRLPAVERIMSQVRLAAQTGAPVFLRGERGTGKETVARLIHNLGSKDERSFAALNCAHLPPDAMSAVLFGEGGLTLRPAIGTIFLKEPSRLPRDLQSRLVDGYGDGQATDDDLGRPRLIAASCLDPLEEVRAGKLLEELRASLCGFELEMVPLRNRRIDLPDLVTRLLERIQSNGDQRSVTLSTEAWDIVNAYPWPGNLSELHAALVSARSRSSGEKIEVADLPAPIRLTVRMQDAKTTNPDRPMPLDKLLEETERRLIQVALRRAKGNKTRAAEILSVWRPRLLRRMEALGIADMEKEPKPSENA